MAPTSSPFAARSTLRSPSSGRLPSRARRRSSTASTPTASRARRPPRSRSARPWATLPTRLFIPVGNAGNITAYWKGFVQAAGAGMARQRPRMYGYQAEGAAPLVSGKPVAEPQTVATAIRIGNPASWKGAVAARDESGGAIDAVSDAEILDAYSFLARCEGVFAEPASAAAIAGLRKRVRANALGGARRIVCVLTGNGMKDPDRARSLAGDIAEVEATPDAVRKALRS